MSDNLTGLANRTQFHQRLDEAIAGAERADSRIGLALYPDDAASGDDLVNKADAGIYSVRALRKSKLPAEAQARTAAGR